MEPWYQACRTVAGRLERALADLAPAERRREIGAGEGGDTTVAVDELAEDLVFAELERLHQAGERFTVVSEERGEVDFGGDGVRVVVDPIDGSLNAKRGLPAFSLSVAVADGPTLEDVVFGFVHDFGWGEEWVATRGKGASRDGERLDPAAGEHRCDDGRLEILAVESADPRWVAASLDGLLDSAHRLRAFGSIALSLVQVAAARADGMVSLRNARSFDVAAAQLVVREAGGHVSFPRCDGPLDCPLDLEPRSPVVAARTPESLARLTGIPT